MNEQAQKETFLSRNVIKYLSIIFFVTTLAITVGGFTIMSTNIGRLDSSTFLTFAQAYNAVLNYMSLEADLLTEYLIEVIVERKYSFGRKIIPSCINTVQSALKVHLNVLPSSHCSAASLFFGVPV